MGNNKVNYLHKGDSLYISMTDYFNNKTFSKFLNEKKYTTDQLSGLGITSRNLNYLVEELQILRPEREGEKGWQKFSFMDIFWIRILVDLRKFGFRKEALQNAREHLINPVIINRKGKKHSEYPELEFYVASFIRNPRRFYLAVFSDGSNCVGLELEFDEKIMIKELDTHIKIPLHKYLTPMLKSLNKNDKYEHIPSRYIYATEDEQELINQIRDYNIIRANLEMKNGDLKIVKITKSYNSKEVSFNDLDKQFTHQTIETIKKGKNKFFQQNYKKKFKGTQP